MLLKRKHFRAIKLNVVFFHPDYTVGFGITPNLQSARGL